MSTTGARWLHSNRNHVVRELTPYGRELLRDARKQLRSGKPIETVVNFVSRRRAGAYQET